MKNYLFVCILVCSLSFCIAEDYFYGYTGDGTVPPSPEWAHDAVFYSINVQHFGKPQTPGSYFEKAAAELEYIKQLGANTVVVNPVTDFLDDMDPKFWNAYYMKAPSAISDAYGGAEDFKDFVSKAHSLGLRVIVDTLVRPLYADGEAAKKILAAGNHDWFAPGLTKEELEKPFKGDSVGMYNPVEGKFTFVSQDIESQNHRKDYILLNQGGAETKPVIGDWNGDQRDSVGIRKKDGTFVLTDVTDTGEISKIDYQFVFGPAGENIIPIAGDWNGDGFDTVGIYNSENAIFYLKNSLEPGDADIMIRGIKSGWIPITGDWDGDGADEVGEYDPESAIFYHYDSDGEMYSKPYSHGGEKYAAVCGDWNGDGNDSIAVISISAGQKRGFKDIFVYFYRNALSSGGAHGSYELNLKDGYKYPVVGNVDFNAKRGPSLLFGNSCYEFQWDNPGLQEFMIENWVDLVKRFGFDGYRLDCEAYQTVLAPFGNQNVWKRVWQRCHERLGKDIFLIAEMDGMGHYNIHAEQDSFGVLTNLHWDPQGKNRNFMVNANIVDIATTLENTYYTMTLSCHDHHEYQAKGRRSTFGYMVFSPFLPWWRMGEEVNARKFVPQKDSQKGYDEVLYFRDMDWQALENPEKKAFYEDVRKMLHLRKEYKDIISPFCSQFKDRNFTAIHAEGCKLQVYAHYGNETAIVVSAKLDESDGDVILNIGSQKLEEMNLDGFEKFRVTEKLYRPNESRVLNKSQLNEFCQYVENNNVVFIVIEGVK
jgi:hypothetical protein